MRRRGVALSLACAGAIGVAGCNPPEPPVCTDSEETEAVSGECLPPAFTAEPQGDDVPLTLGAALEAETPDESGTLMVTGSGDELVLANGFRLEVPAGALPPGTLTVNRYDLEPTVYRFVSPTQPTQSLGVTLPIEGDLAGAGPEDVYVLWFHDGEPEALMGTVDAGARTITVNPSRLSEAVVVNTSPGTLPPVGSGDRIVRVPYYNQGSTFNCWSMALLMLLTAYGANVEPWHNNAFFHLKAEHGLPWWAYQHGGALPRYIRETVPGHEVERRSWFTGSSATLQRLHDYLLANMRAGRPTLVWYPSPALHMVLFVGVEGDAFVLHDPGQGVYVRERWEQIVPRFQDLPFNGTGTLALDVPASDSPWKASILLPFAAAPNNGLDFVAAQDDGILDQSSRLVFSWYLEELQGPGLLRLSTGGVGTLTSRHRAFATLNVTNIVDKAGTTSFRVGLEIAQKGGSVVYRHPEVAVEVAGNQDRDVDLFKAVRGKPVTDLVEEPGEYTATAYVGDGTTRFDTIVFPFSVARAAKKTSCGDLTGDFRSGCGGGNDCTCVGNAFCDGIAGQSLACDDLAKACDVHCLFFDDGTCECPRYCEMLLSRSGCGG